MEPLRNLTLAFVCTFIVSNAVALEESVTVTGGDIRGALDGDVYVYKGVPFAAPPVGDLRWKAPQPVEDWDGVRDATEFSDNCPQTPYPKQSVYYREPRPTSEDCLCLNVWTAAEASDDLRPVMVWIHGGALTRGSGAVDVYDGSNLAREGVVIVTINYRLGPFGYFAHPELTAESEHNASGNYGVLDQIAALAWVRDNITKFGGDPGNVTIFGESAGSWSVCALQATPLAKGLFHRAIGESGGAFGPMAWLGETKHGQISGEDLGMTFAKSLTDDGSVEALRALSADDILRGFSRNVDGESFRTRPIVDGYVIPDEIYQIFAAGKQNDVPVIVGSNKDEGTSLLGPAGPKTREAVAAWAKEEFGDLSDEFAATYPFADDASARAAFLAAFRDRTFSWQMRTWARLMSTVESPAYLYHFTRVPPRPDRDQLGAYHAAEIIYAFDNLEKSPLEWEDADRRVADAMSAYWINFAEAGDPNGDNLPKWEPYSKDDEDYLHIGDTIAQKQGLLTKENDFFEQVIEAERAMP